MPFSNIQEPLPALAPERKSRDPLTCLPRVEALTASIAEASGPVAVIVLDLDALKAVNAQHGYAAGDFVLHHFARRLLEAVGPQGLAVRLEADRFALLVRGSCDPDSALRLAFDLCDRLSRPFGNGATVPAPSVTAGVALSSPMASSPSALVAAAEQALAFAKERQTRAVLFEEDATAGSRARKLAAGEIDRAFRLGEWRLYYQPQIREPGRWLDGIEALLRWQHPERGLLTPDAFLNDLRNHTSASRIGRWIIDQACCDLSQWRRNRIAVPRVAINLFSDPSSLRSFRSDVLQGLRTHGLAPADLELEVTEDIVVESRAAFLADLESLRTLGVQVALDDFGTGFACLATLRQLPITSLKIDRSFVSGMETGVANRAVARAVLSIGRELGLRVVAEGVETGPQVVRLMNMGCRVFQGFRYAPALPAREIGARMSRACLRRRARGNKLWLQKNS